MKQRDHRALAYYLQEQKSDLHGWRWRMFLIGNICPDYIPFTYMRGMRKSHGMLGHNTPYSHAHIQKQIQKIQRRGVYRCYDFFVLGTLMHYLADSFTLPHTLPEAVSMEEHRSYEWQLHRLMEKRLWNKPTERRLPFFNEPDLMIFLHLARREYEHSPKCTELDCRLIIEVCGTVFARLCPRNRKAHGEELYFFSKKT